MPEAKPVETEQRERTEEKQDAALAISASLAFQNEPETISASLPFGSEAETIVSIDEAAALHPGEWILMKVTDLDQDKLPSRGRIAAHWLGYDKNISTSLTRAFSSPNKHPGARYYLFSGYHYARSGAELRKAIEEAAREGDAGAWRRW